MTFDPVRLIRLSPNFPVPLKVQMQCGKEGVVGAILLTLNHLALMFFFLCTFKGVMLNTHPDNNSKFFSNAQRSAASTLIIDLSCC